MNRYSAICVGLMMAMLAQGGAPTSFNYQGRLFDSNGAPATGSVQVAIGIYNAPSNGTQHYYENVGAVPLFDGIYSFNWGPGGTSLWSTTELMGTANGVQSVFTYTAQHTPIINPSVTITAGAYSWNDVTGSSSPGQFLGTVSSYTTGNVSAIYLVGAPSSGTVVNLQYSYNQLGAQRVLTELSNLWLQVWINGSPLSPRQSLVAVPYASYAGDIPNDRKSKPLDTIEGWSYQSASGDGIFRPMNSIYPDRIMPFSGSVRALTHRSVEMFTNGTATIRVYKNGQPTSCEYVITPGNSMATNHLVSFPSGEAPFVAGDLVSAWIRLSSDFSSPMGSPTHRVNVTVEYDQGQ